MTWRGTKQTREQREEIIAAYLADPETAIQIAISRGLSPLYAYNLVRERGLLPRKGEVA